MYELHGVKAPLKESTKLQARERASSASKAALWDLCQHEYSMITFLFFLPFHFLKIQS